VADRAAADVFADTCTFTVNDPCGIENVTHDASALTVAAVFNDTTTGCDPAAAVNDKADADNVICGAAPFCVTFTVRVTCGEPTVVTNVTVADRAVTDVFAATCTFTVNDPCGIENDTHDASALTVTAVFNDTTTGCDPAAAVNDNADVDNVICGAAAPCVTDTDRVTGTPTDDSVEKVTTADRGDVDGFADTDTDTDLSPLIVPDGTVTHDEFDATTVHDVFDDTSTGNDPATAVNGNTVFDTDNDGTTAGDEPAA